MTQQYQVSTGSVRGVLQMAVNCWEFLQCQRQPGGPKVDELGHCPASLAAEHRNVNRGHNAGRRCWRVAGTLCKGEVAGTTAAKIRDCLRCPFLQLVRKEEGTLFES
jgi:eukaryotic-like serine/threonine-protein kinase